MDTSRPQAPRRAEHYHLHRGALFPGASATAFTRALPDMMYNLNGGVRFVCDANEHCSNLLDLTVVILFDFVRRNEGVNYQNVNASFLHLLNDPSHHAFDNCCSL